MKTPVFRYVVLDLTANYALEVEVNKLYKVGDKFSYYDDDDRQTHEFRVLRIEGTVYNKSKAELEYERKGVA